jgi:hypothetical protein
MPKIDNPVTSGKTEERGKRWVVVPEKDLFDYTYPTIRVNMLGFGPGKHYLDADLADFVEDRMRVKNAADIRIMRPNQDVTSQNAMNRYGPAAGRGSFVDPETLGA